MGPQLKFAQILDLHATAAQIHPVFTRNHVTVQISHGYCNENRETDLKIQDLYPVCTCKPISCAKKVGQREQMVKNLRIAQHLPCSMLKRIFNSNT